MLTFILCLFQPKMEDKTQNNHTFKEIFKETSDVVTDSESVESLLDASYYDGDITEELVGTLSEMSEQDHQSVIYISEEDIFENITQEDHER